jgi:NitT/TauT family transport system permease protein
MKSSERIFFGLVGVLVLLAVWHFSVVFTHTKIFPSPMAVARGLNQLAHKGLLWRYIGDSLRRVLTGYSLAVLIGVPLGIVLGWFPAAGRAFNPLIQMLRPISPLAWMPLAVIWFGVSELSPIFLIFLSAFFSLLVSCMNAVRNVPAVYLLGGRNFGLSSGEMLRRVVFPAMLPRLLTGLRLSLGIAWIVVVAAEMIAVDSGLGYLIIDSRNAGKRYDLVVAGMLIIGVIGLALDVLLRRVERIRSVQWGFRA